MLTGLELYYICARTKKETDAIYGINSVSMHALHV